MYFLKQIYSICAMSRQSLYHFTTLKGSYEILKSNTLNLGKRDQISFTRNKRFILVHHKSNIVFNNPLEIPGIQIGFRIDTDKLRSKYKLDPIVNPLFYNKILSPDRSNRPDLNRFQYEEVIYKPLKNFNTFVEEILVNVDFNDWKPLPLFPAEGDTGFVKLHPKQGDVLKYFEKIKGKKLDDSQGWSNAELKPALRFSLMNNTLVYLQELLRTRKLTAKSKVNAVKAWKRQNKAYKWALETAKEKGKVETYEVHIL